MTWHWVSGLAFSLWLSSHLLAPVSVALQGSGAVRGRQSANAERSSNNARLARVKRSVLAQVKSVSSPCAYTVTRRSGEVSLDSPFDRDQIFGRLLRRVRMAESLSVFAKIEIRQSDVEKMFVDELAAPKIQVANWRMEVANLRCCGSRVWVQNQLLPNDTIRLRTDGVEIAYDPSVGSLVLSKPTSLHFWTPENVYVWLPFRAKQIKFLEQAKWDERRPKTSTASASRVEVSSRLANGVYRFWCGPGPGGLLRAVAYFAKEDKSGGGQPFFVMLLGAESSQQGGSSLAFTRSMAFSKHGDRGIRWSHCRLSRLTNIVSAGAIKIRVKKRVYLWDSRPAKPVYYGDDPARWPREALPLVQLVPDKGRRK